VEFKEAEEQVALQCPACQANIRESDSFCGNCGKAVGKVEEHHSNEDIFNRIAPTLLFYFANLIVLAVYKLTPVFGEDFDGLIAVSIIDVSMVTGFSIYFWKSLIPLFSLRSLKIHVLGATMISAIACALLVNVIADFINFSLFDEVSSYDSQFTEELAHPFLWATLLICIQPALFEELTFRGFLYNNINGVTNTMGTILITSFMFGFMHLSFISLLWLIPLGLAAAWLRSRYNTLWYGMVAHFFYNFTITALEFN
jgi:uncharacterized protein